MPLPSFKRSARPYSKKQRDSEQQSDNSAARGPSLTCLSGGFPPPPLSQAQQTFPFALSGPVGKLDFLHGELGHLCSRGIPVHSGGLERGFEKARQSELCPRRGKLSLVSFAEATDHRNSPEPFWEAHETHTVGGGIRDLVLRSRW